MVDAGIYTIGDTRKQSRKQGCLVPHHLQVGQPGAVWTIRAIRSHVLDPRCAACCSTLLRSSPSQWRDKFFPVGECFKLVEAFFCDVVNNSFFLLF